VTLSILAWDHPRATAPLAACSEAWEQLTGEPLTIRTRSLRAFGDDVPAPDGTDLVLIDHPHVGGAAAAGSILSLSELLEEGELDRLASASAGPSHASYEHKGHHWAVAIDAACQAMAVARGSDSASAPATWEEVLSLARDRPGQVAVPLQPAHAISAVLSMIAAREPVAAGPQLGSDASIAWATATLSALAAAGPREAFEWEPPEALDELARGSVLCVPIVYAYVGYEVRWHAAPAFARGGVPGSILGGVGAAVVSGAQDPRAAARLAVWLGSGDVQEELVLSAGGQPATRSSWCVPGSDPMFQAVLPTLEMSQVRPRDAWWPDFQGDAGELLARRLRAATDADVIAADLARLYRDHRELSS
jgi:multiple sugar transport system substrate-binding protein